MAIFAAGILGLALTIPTVYATGLFSLRHVIGAEIKKEPAGPQTISCRGRSVMVATELTPALSWTFVLRNNSDDTVFLMREGASVWLSSEESSIISVPVQVVSWSAAEQEVLKISSGDAVWVSVAGTISPAILPKLAASNRIGDVPHATFVWFSAVDYKDVGCSTQDFAFPETEKPIVVVR